MWELMTLAALMVLSGGAWVAEKTWSQVRFNERLKAFHAVLTSYGLHAEKGPGISAGRLNLKARSMLFKVHVQEIPREMPWPVEVVVAPRKSPPGFAEIRIRPGRNKPEAGSPFETGDGAFDSTFVMEGPIASLSALLDAETRRLLSAVKAESGVFEIADGELRAEARHAPETLGLLLDIGRRWVHPLNVAQRLAQNAGQDPESAARLRNLLLLTREFPGRPETIAALRTACTDASPQIRLRAAQELGAKGHDILVAFAESAEDDTISAQAVSILGPELPIERARAILVQALRRRRLQTARACLEALGSGGAPEDVETLAKVLAREKSELAAAAAEALGATGNPTAEPHLLPALQHEKVDVRIVAAKALGRAGTAAAVLPLKEAAEGSHDRELRSAARQAIAEIQSRLQGASPGQLSLTAAEAGELSLTEEQGGELSLPDDEDGRLSLPAEEGPPPPAGS
jgi:hypothetical protein